MLDNLYTENIEQSGAFLRLALKEIARYNLSYTPVTYAVWYEFATGRNHELNNEIHHLKKTSTPVTCDMVLEWFRKYIANQQLIVAEQKTRELQSILSEMTRYLGSSGTRLDDQGHQLEAYAEQLEKTASVEEVMDISYGIMTKTRAMIGDNVLKMLSKLLQEHIKGKDIAARYGGEEFVIVLPDTALKDAFVVAEQIRLKLRAMRWRTKSGTAMGAITMSLGVAQYKPGESLDTLIDRADNALYQAKSDGRNRTLTELDIDAA